ncbi:hypothetical protein FRC12_014550 [Ceratobasidium sp. 428]|nr:hypothetical protein FRC12_014550 [Ceratobasidium sp. 428]
MIGYIDGVPGLLGECYQESTECFNDDYATWLKVIQFLRVQDRSTPLQLGRFGALVLIGSDADGTGLRYKRLHLMNITYR